MMPAGIVSALPCGFTQNLDRALRDVAAIGRCAGRSEPCLTGGDKAILTKAGSSAGLATRR